MVACCQFDPKLGERDQNMQVTSALLSQYKKGDFDLLLLPEMSFTGIR